MNILKYNSMFITSPLDLNDPFEMRPAWTNDHEARFRANQLRLDDLKAGSPILVCTEQGVVDSGQVFQPPVPDPLMDVEHQLGIADGHNGQVFEHMHAKYRILSLVADLMPTSSQVEEQRSEKSTLLWAHYADQFQGVCIAVDPDQFPNGIRPQGYRVSYSTDRRYLPPEEYDSVLRLSAHIPADVGYVIDHSTGLELPPDLKAELDQLRYVELLRHKSPAWDYEHEVRMIYDLPALKATSGHRDVWLACAECKSSGKEPGECSQRYHRDAVHIPETAIRAVIFGADCQGEAARQILALLAEERYSHVDLYWSSLHSAKHLIQYTKSTPDYIAFIQQHRSNEIAIAKGHRRSSKSGFTVKPAPKGFNYPGWAKGCGA